MNRKSVVFFAGICDTKKLIISKVKEDGTFKVHYDGHTNISNHINEKKFDHKIYLLDTNKQQTINFTSGIHAVFNEISEPDTHTRSLKKVEDIKNQLPKNIKFFNTPKNIMKTSRNNIYTLLNDIPNLIVPKTVKIQVKSPKDIYNTIKKHNFIYPVIFRKAGDHGGISMSLIENEKDNEKFYPYALDNSDFYITQYIEYKQNNFYKKYRLVVVDGKVFIRSCMIGKTWMLNHHSRDKETHLIELEILKSSDIIVNKIQTTITKIHKKLDLDYFGIDCAIDVNYKITIFEINANMNIFHVENSEFNKYVDPIKEAVISMIEK